MNIIKEKHQVQEFKNNTKIELHKPHPNNVLKMYQINLLLKKLFEEEDI